MATAEIPSAVKAALLSGGAELGDKTFFVAMLLSAWVAQCGRARCLVFAGAVSALALHAGATAYAHRVDVLANRHASLHFFAASLFLGLGIKAFLDLTRADSEALRKRQTERHGDPASKFEGNPYAAQLMDQNKYMMPSSFQPSEDDTNPFASDLETRPFGSESASSSSGFINGYGTATSYQGERSYDVAAPMDAPEDPQEDNLPALLCILASSFVLVAIAELGDKSAMLLDASQLRGSNLFMGAALGYTVVTALSVIIGMVLRWHLSERRLLFSAVLASFALSMASLSEGLTCFGQSHKWTALLPLHAFTGASATIESLLQVES